MIREPLTIYKGLNKAQRMRGKKTVETITIIVTYSHQQLFQLRSLLDESVLETSGMIRL